MASHAVKAMPPSERTIEPSTPIVVPLIKQTTYLNQPVMLPFNSDKYSDASSIEQMHYPTSNQAAELIDNHH